MATLMMFVWCFLASLLAAQLGGFLRAVEEAGIGSVQRGPRGRRAAARKRWAAARNGHRS